MFEKVMVYVLGVLIGIPVLLWYLIRAIFTGSWTLVCFVLQHQYRELKRICEHGKPAELQAFLAAHPGAKEYIVYSRQDKSTTKLVKLFQLPAPLDVAVRANNLEVIPVLLANGASPEIRSISGRESPAEVAIDDSEKMRALCGGKPWWLERSAKQDALDTGYSRRILWNVMRGARLTSREHLCRVSFLRLPKVMKEFVCRFGIQENLREEIYEQLKQITPEEKEQIAVAHIHFWGPRSVPLLKEFDEMMLVMEQSLQPLPQVDEEDRERLLFSTGLMDRTRMLDLLNTLFGTDQQFALLQGFTQTPPPEEIRELTEDAVALLMCSILKQAGERV